MNSTVGNQSQASQRMRVGMLIARVTLVISALLLASSPLSAGAVTTGGVIAYVRAGSGDQIRLIAPDGSDDRLLWSHGQPDEANELQVWELAWRPDGGELAFASDHENSCSILHSDLFAVSVGGGGYRRITQAPACAALAGYPKGTVRVPVENVSIYNSVTAFLYVQGAPGKLPVSLPPGGSTIVTFSNVADFGDGWLQAVAEIGGSDRVLHFGATVDVVAGASVDTAPLYLPGGVVPGMEVRSPSWRYDGSELAYATGYNSVRHIAPHPDPLALGDPLLPLFGGRPDIILRAYWGPTAARANQILYDGFEASDSAAIYLITEGGSGTGQMLVTYPVYDRIMGLAWLPDGTGFVYSVIETDFYVPVNANIFIYTFASGQPVQVTDFDSSFTGELSVSPDGQQIVFERSASLDALEAGVTDLWLVNRGGSGLQLLVADAGAPAWGPEGQPAEPGTHKLYLPLVMR